MIPPACAGCGAEPVVRFYLHNGDAWRLCLPCLACVESESDGRGVVGETLAEARRENYRTFSRESSALAGRCHGHEMRDEVRSAISAPCLCCEGMTEPGDRYIRVTSGAGGKRYSWRLCWSCGTGTIDPTLPRESWRVRELAESNARLDEFEDLPDPVTVSDAELAEIPF